MVTYYAEIMFVCCKWANGSFEAAVETGKKFLDLHRPDVEKYPNLRN